jgi:transposase
MSLARLVVTGVLVEGRPKAAVARDYGVSRRWVHELVRRFQAEGEAGLEPRSRRPRASPHRHDSRLHHIKVGRRHARTRVLMLVSGRDVRIVSEDGELLRELVLDPSRDYQPMGSR